MGFNMYFHSLMNIVKFVKSSLLHYGLNLASEIVRLNVYVKRKPTKAAEYIFCCKFTHHVVIYFNSLLI